MTSRRTVLVTGSARGLGLATARAFRDRGHDVHLQWRSSRDLARALEEEFPGRVHRADLLERDACRALVDAVVRADGRLDHLVHCVGEYASGSAEETVAREMRRMWCSNVESSVHVFDAARAPLRAARGTAVFLGCAGLDALRGRTQVAAYAAAKSALCVLARSWALEEAPFGVRVNLVSPGVVPHAHADPDTLAPDLADAVPLGGPGRPEDVAAACLWLSSAESAHVTGVNLPVTGGWQG